MLLPLHLNLGVAATAPVVGTPITNANATEVRSNYFICPVSGFRQYPRWDKLSQIRTRWDGELVRADSLDPRWLPSTGSLHGRTGASSCGRYDLFKRDQTDIHRKT